MIKHALFVRFEAKPGKESAVAQFLAAGMAMANEEATTPIWFARQPIPTTFGPFDAFETDHDRQAHLNEPITRALMERASELLATNPTIESIDVLGFRNRPRQT